jgi:hypothetical protein
MRGMQRFSTMEIALAVVGLLLVAAAIAMAGL